MRPKTAALFELAALALCIFLFLWWAYPDREPVPEPVITVATSTPPAFPSVDIEATAAYVYDVREGKALFQKNAALQLPLASLTKVMTAYTASRLVPDHVLVRITPEDIRVEGDSGLFVGEEWDVSDLIDFSLVVSSNDGARALASVGGAMLATTSSDPVADFVREMNANAHRLGMRSTYFLNPSGLDESPELSGGYGSAKDVATLFAKVLESDPRIFEATRFESLQISSRLAAHAANNTNKAVAAIPNVIGSKTGFTDLSGGNLAVAFDAGLGRPIVIALLNSSREGRFSDMVGLVYATLEHLAKTAQ